MEIPRAFGIAGSGSQSARPFFWTLILLSLLPVCIVLPMAPVKIGIAIIIGWIALLWIAVSIVRKQFHYVIPLWVAFYPYCYYLFSFPAEKSIFTVDRAFILLLSIEMLMSTRRGPALVPLPRDLVLSGFFWIVFLLVCFLSLAGHATSEILPAYRSLVDGMLLPPILGLYVIRHFPFVRDLRKLHSCACILGIGLCITGLIELTTGFDLFPWVGSVPMFTDTHIRRADGPFEQQIVMSMVGILAFFFIVYLRRLMPEKVSPWRTLLHRVGFPASLGAALLPLDRGLIFALAPIALIECCSKHRLIPRRAWAAFFGIVVLAAIATRLVDPRLYDDRVSGPDNIYQRIAQHQETLRVVSEYPLFGVGFGLYHDVASQNPRYMVKWNGIESMNFPHNVMMTVLAEEGLVGLLLYASAQFFLIHAMWKIRKAYPPGWLAFLYCVLIYLLTGIVFATLSFSDINLFYILILGCIYQLQVRVAREQEMAAAPAEQDLFMQIA